MSAAVVAAVALLTAGLWLRWSTRGVIAAYRVGVRMGQIMSWASSARRERAAEDFARLSADGDR